MIPARGSKLGRCVAPSRGSALSHRRVLASHALPLSHGHPFEPPLSPPPIPSAVQASIAANTYVVSGHAEMKKLQDLLPGIINQLGPDNLANLKKLAETSQRGGAPPPTAGADDDEDVPDLVDNFEEASK